MSPAVDWRQTFKSKRASQYSSSVRQISVVRKVLTCMNVTFLERVEARAASRFRPSSLRKSWICDRCRIRLERSQRFTHALSTIQKKDGPVTRTGLRLVSTKQRRDDFLQSLPPLSSDPGPEQNDNLETEQPGDAETEAANRPSSKFGEAILRGNDDLLYSDFTDPENWPLAQWHATRQFREFLEEQAQPETRLERQKDEQDPYGILLALRTRDTERMIVALENAADDGAYLQNLPRSTWAEIMHTIHNHAFNIERHKVHRSFNQNQLASAGFDYLPIIERYLKILTGVLRIRRNHRILPDIADYHVLLTLAARVGSQVTARWLWADMQKAEIQPDRICYNRFIEAIVWDENSRLRLKRKAKGSLSRAPAMLTNVALHERGRSNEVAELVNQMRKDGVQPDIATYCVFMSVLARDGDFESAINLLSTVWNINIAALESGRDDAVLKKKYPRGSLLYPTPRLLVTIAETYGLANRMLTGFRVVDYICRHYDIPLQKHIWYQLLRWTWLQARVKEHERTIPEDDPQQLHENTVRTLLDTMASEPYNIELDFDLHLLAFKNFMNGPFAFTHAFDPTIAIEIIESVKIEHIKLLQMLWTTEQRMKPELKGPPTWKPLSGNGVFSLAYPNDKSLRVEKKLYGMTLAKWTRQMLSLPRAKHGIDLSSGPHNEALTDWRVRGLPRFLGFMSAFAPSQVRYHTDTGIVNLTFRTVAEVEIAEARREAGNLKNHPSARKKLTIRLAGERRAQGMRTKLYRPHIPDKIMNFELYEAVEQDDPDVDHRH